MLVYTIYDHPKDFPDHYVVRAWRMVNGLNTPDAELFFKSEELEACRKKLRDHGMSYVGRWADEDPCIKESWISL